MCRLERTSASYKGSIKTQTLHKNNTNTQKTKHQTEKNKNNTAAVKKII
jgi:hypothetical protein